MTFRPMVDADLQPEVLSRLSDAIPGLTVERYRSDLAAGRCRPEWSWVAEVDGRVAGRALWWGLPDSELPLALECLQVAASAPDRSALAVALLEHGFAALRAHGLRRVPPLTLELPGGWRSEPAIRAAVEWRRAAARSIGLTAELERLRFEWTPARALPAPSGRLVLTPEMDDDVMAQAFQRVAEGSLDIETVRGIRAVGPERQAREELEFYRSMPGERSWWRLAHTPAGDLVGLAVPSRNAYGPNVGYLGVVPEQRGHGYVDDLLAEITRFHAVRGADRITGTTDTTNTPMAAAFSRSGYDNTEMRLLFVDEEP